MREVCSTAGLTERYFYESFDSFDGFVDAVLDDVIAQLGAEVLDNVRDEQEPAAIVVATLAAAIDAFADDPRRARLLLAETLGEGGGLARRRSEVMALGTEQAMAARRALGASASPTELQLVSVALAGATAELFLAWAEGRLDVTRGELLDFLVGTYERITGVTLVDMASRSDPIG